jgi:ubiquinone/menaquinone biosynthesis C-methylase UbiE
MQRRSTETHAAFVLPFLQPDFRILELGCGPGSISTDLATRVPQGSIVAVDAEPSRIQLARERAKELGISNIRLILNRLSYRHPMRSTRIASGLPIIWRNVWT